MEAFVKKGYVVFDGAKRYEGGTQLPPSVIPYAMATQSWKIEVNDGKQERKESPKVKEETRKTTSDDRKEREEVEEIVDSTINRMMKYSDTKKR